MNYYNEKKYSIMDRIKLSIEKFRVYIFSSPTLYSGLFTLLLLTIHMATVKFFHLPDEVKAMFLILVLTAGIVMYFFCKRSDKEYDILEKKHKFCIHVYTALESKLLTDADFDELLILFESISEIEKSDRSFDQSLDQYLDYAIATLCKSEERSEERQDSIEKKRNIIKQIKKYKALNLKKNPNLYLPDYERQLFESITVYLDEGNTLMVKEKLSQLSGAVKTVHEDVAKNTKITKWSYRLTIVGLVLAVLPGISQAWAWLSHIFNLSK